MLTYELKRELLGIARCSIAAALQQQSQRMTAIASKELMHPGGAFVTLRIKKELRGCIGYLESTHPLAEVVAEVAVKAAMDDPRFPSLGMSEFDQTSVEISILSPLRRIQSKDEIKIGEHGLMLEFESCKGVLLPQVAVEYGWDAAEFPEAVCRKAGANRSDWQYPEARISVFAAEVISEEAVRLGHRA